MVSQGVEDPRCPNVDGGRSVRLPHESDCSRHYLYQNGRIHLMPACPAQKLFDSVTLRCVFAAEATCGEIETTVTSTEATTSVTNVPTVGSSVQSTNEPSTVVIVLLPLTTVL